MPGSIFNRSGGEFAGDNGDRIYQVVHNDIDESEIDVRCREGSVSVSLYERIWWSWNRRHRWTIDAGRRINTDVDVDSSWYDGDHRLMVTATSDGTSCDVDFGSRDR